jgi:hypothetical protein
MPVPATVATIHNGILPFFNKGIYLLTGQTL